MNIIKPSVDILFHNDPIKILKQLEFIGRKCYKSEDKITDTTYSDFIKKIINSGHHSILEHFSITVTFITDRGISHELVRHRVASPTQESTRYANYMKEKFGSEITLIDPFFFDPNEQLQEINVPMLYDSYRVTNNLDTNNTICPFFGNFKKYMMNSLDVWYLTCALTEWGYMSLISDFKRSPQEARSILPNSLKTDISITANIREWRHILALRAVGTTGSPHPQMRQIMLPVLKELYNNMPIIFDDLYNMAEDKKLYNNNFGDCDITINTL